MGAGSHVVTVILPVEPGEAEPRISVNHVEYQVVKFHYQGSHHSHTVLVEEGNFVKPMPADFHTDGTNLIAAARDVLANHLKEQE